MRLTRLTLTAGLLAGLCATLAWSGRAPAAASQPAATRPVQLSDVIKPRDRVLFLGDDVTQQGYYTRGVAAALLSLMPGDGLRFFNGGMDGATAATFLTPAVKGKPLSILDDLLQLCRPTVVFVCLGLNDGQEKPPSQDITTGYRKHLTELTRTIKSFEGVRLVILLGPPAVQRTLSQGGAPTGYNLTLQALAEVAREVAGEQRAGFADLFGHTHAVNQEATRMGVPLTLGGRMPNEEGHVIIASVILHVIGASDEQMRGIAWCPLPPRRMAPIRQALAVRARAQPGAVQPGKVVDDPGKRAELERMQLSRELYEGLRPFDEDFFYAWRLSGRTATATPRDKMLASSETAWGKIEAVAREVHDAGK